MLIKDFLQFRTNCPSCNSDLRVILNHTDCTHSYYDDILEIKYLIPSSKQSLKKDLPIFLLFDLCNNTFSFSSKNHEDKSEEKLSKTMLTTITNVFYNRKHRLYKMCPNKCYHYNSNDFELNSNLDINISYERLSLHKNDVDKKSVSGKFFINDHEFSKSVFHGTMLPMIPITSYKDTLNRFKKLSYLI